MRTCTHAVHAGVEDLGMDLSKHGGSAYENGIFQQGSMHGFDDGLDRSRVRLAPHSSMCIHACA